MPNDAKLGLVLGVGIVVVVAVVFFRKDQGLPLPGEVPAAVNAPAGPAPLPPRDMFRPVRAKTAVQDEAPVTHTAERHPS